jgi:hypothetical protein
MSIQGSTNAAGSSSGLEGTLSRRALNRAALERQLLLRRADLSAAEAIGRLVGLQAQEPNAPYIGLWARLSEFRQDALTQLLYDRQVVRASVLRGTQHLVAAEDFLWLRPLVQPALDRGRQAAFGRRTAGVDLAELAAVARALLAGRTLTRPQLRRLLAERWPDRDAEALAWSVQCLLPLIHRPPNGTWKRGGSTPFTLAEDWLGRPLGAPAPEVMIRRYLAAFGPAAINDIQAWSGLTRLSEVVEQLRPQLRTFHDEAGNQLFDLPDAPLPDPDTPAPPRFLPNFDNLMVAYADRTRIMTDQYRKRICIGAWVAATVLIDGQVCGMWRIQSNREAATLRIELFETIAEPERIALEEEGARLLAFAAGDAQARSIQITQS